MKVVFLVPCLMSFHLAFTQQPLKEYNWKNRLIILSGEQETEEFSKQLSAFKSQADELEERDLLLIQLNKTEGKIGDLELSRSEIEEIKKAYSIPSENLHLILIGKDGGVKMRKNTFTPPEDFFALIDTMPMRKAEMRKNDN